MAEADCRSGGRTREDHKRKRKTQNADVQLSKALSWLLRHGAVKEGFVFDEGGYLNVEDILSHRNFKKYTFQDIETVVAKNDKKRFTLKQNPITGKFQICANQGHSVEVKNLELEPITDPEEIPILIHGTYLKNLNKIKEKGLSRMNRNHIHLSPGKIGEEGVISGMRASSEVFIYIDGEKALHDGITFFRSTNNVILSPGNKSGFLTPNYFMKIEVREKATDSRNYHQQNE